MLHHILTAREQAAITRAALLAHAGKHAEAEAVRFAAGYHERRQPVAVRRPL